MTPPQTTADDAAKLTDCGQQYGGPADAGHCVWPIGDPA
jgi:hypothetical protein